MIYKLNNIQLRNQLDEMTNNNFSKLLEVECFMLAAKYGSSDPTQWLDEKITINYSGVLFNGISVSVTLHPKDIFADLPGRSLL